MPHDEQLQRTVVWNRGRGAIALFSLRTRATLVAASRGR